MSAQQHVYVLGINAKLGAEAEARWGTFDDIMKKIEVDLARAERNGFPCTLQVVDSGNVDKSLAEFEANLIAGKDKYSALMFGGGIRTNPDPLPFEKAISIARKVLKPDVLILFNDGPDRHSWAIERGFGVKMEIG
ncbi:hypothetical protein JX266_011561 [Neoarthrinium moseri]|uniref:uncharacterized protein n=1 Tax=Neoarthrinium moseri TaxID=1658444 RepID=UPI001FDCF80B|nr:uncharacterized protein JN550_002622 [Neoarthrinium moseri]KAI1842276.1 hypothetical protein JX266_011561 [Neoarthrinium moseri]KAI1874043.1 hypothetical protein JN550_002622 [Neoarthrinium moseri]